MPKLYEVNNRKTEAVHMTLGNFPSGYMVGPPIVISPKLDRDWMYIKYESPAAVYHVSFISTGAPGSYSYNGIYTDKAANCAIVGVGYRNKIKEVWERATMVHVPGGNPEYVMNWKVLVHEMKDGAGIWAVIALTNDSDSVEGALLKQLMDCGISTENVVVYRSGLTGGLSLGIDRNGNWGELADRAPNVKGVGVDLPGHSGHS